MFFLVREYFATAYTCAWIILEITCRKRKKKDGEEKKGEKEKEKEEKALIQ